MPKILQNVDPLLGFDLMPKGWYPVTVTKVGWVPVKRGENTGRPRLALEYTVTGGPYVERKLFDGGMPTLGGKSASILRGRLEVLQPDVDWGDFDFPGDDRTPGYQNVEAIRELQEALTGATGYALVGHDERPGRADLAELTEKVVRVLGADADPVLAYDEDDEDR